MPPDADVAGWYGKLPSIADFASRRLPAAFIEPWDAWLSAMLTRMQEQTTWLDDYLASPTWRFLLLPGIIDEQAWCGVLMPSVDRVGRYFPFTIAAPISARVGSKSVGAIWTWTSAVESVALDALEQEWDIATVDAALARVRPLIAADEEAACAWSTVLGRRALWWAVQQDAQPRFHFSAGLDGASGGTVLFTPT